MYSKLAMAKVRWKAYRDSDHGKAKKQSYRASEAGQTVQKRGTTIETAKRRKASAAYRSVKQMDEQQPVDEDLALIEFHERRMARSRAWNQSPRGKASMRKYHASEKGKAAHKRFRNSEKGQLAQQRKPERRRTRRQAARESIRLTPGDTYMQRHIIARTKPRPRRRNIVRQRKARLRETNSARQRNTKFLGHESMNRPKPKDGPPREVRETAAKEAAAKEAAGRQAAGRQAANRPLTKKEKARAAEKKDRASEKGKAAQKRQDERRKAARHAATEAVEDTAMQEIDTDMKTRG